MPLINNSQYRAPKFLFNGHLETIYPYLRRNVQFAYERERIHLPDGDFLDLDWRMDKFDRLLILCHGLEGSAQSQYVLGMARIAFEHNWDVLAINFRSCSGEMNHKLRMYHHGEITDLRFIIDRIIDKMDYREISLCGFSLGGNVILKYFGTLGEGVPAPVKKGVAISVPCDLASSSAALDRWDNYLYTRRFRRSLYRKFLAKEERFPGTLALDKYRKVKTWKEFDNTYTTQLTPFTTASEYYEQGSAKNFIAGIRRPTLILNAKNDPFLAPASYPYALCDGHSDVYLQTPLRGGHVGFWHSENKPAYTEKRALEFIET